MSNKFSPVLCLFVLDELAVVQEERLCCGPEHICLGQPRPEDQAIVQ